MFDWIDRHLDRDQRGPQFLHQEAVVKLALAAPLSGARFEHHRLGPFVVMANHLLGRTGEPFWQKESYDHRV